MPAVTDLRRQISPALNAFADKPLRETATKFLATLGYRSDRTISLGDSDPKAFLQFLQEHAGDIVFDQEKALFLDWKSADLLFQLTDEELSSTGSLSKETDIQPGLLRSYLFFAIELTGDHYARGKLTGIARQINRIFPMPVMVLIKHMTDARPVLSIAVINRRQNKVHSEKDVLGKVTIIRDISLLDPHRGHLDILSSFAFENLVHPKKEPITNFDALHAAWEQIFNIELLNERFYRELADWYFWAMRHVHFPPGDTETDKAGLFRSEEKVREHDAKNLIRLLTRLLFVWFIKEKGLVPPDLFHPTELANKYLDGFGPDSKESVYYKAILQNLFFATLNQTRGKREFRKEGQHQNTTTLLRYRRLFKKPDAFIETVEATVPFLNGGLFECLDHPHPTRTGSQGGRSIVYEDGFSDRPDNPLEVPDFLFFGAEQVVDLSDEFGDKKRRKEKVRGLIHILDNYKFTILENTPIDQEIALDPELLGKVFENLLASYNPETKTTARKQTGSFYTPRPIVDYMVDESLKAHLVGALVDKAGMPEADARAGLDILFAYTEREHAFTSREVAVLIEAIDNCNILDPACGSGAFPMGVLHKLVHILSKLDPRDELWKQRQLDKVEATIRTASEIDDASVRESTLADLEAQKADIEEAFSRNELGYGRKLFLIENCLYGVDIQAIATQVSKLRFFISLVVDQTVDPTRDNFGIRPLPNLETKFVTADTLIGIDKPGKQGELFELANVAKLQKELKTVRHNLFSAKTPRTKEKYRARDKELREAIAAELQTNGWDSDVAAKLARWDPYDQNASADFFDPEWMFDRRDFDIVIGNPPYIQIQALPLEQKAGLLGQGYQTYVPTGDIYFLFYEQAANLLRDGGRLAFIVSNSWLPSLTFDKIRMFLTGLTWCSLVSIRTALFTAIVDTVVTVFQKVAPSPEGCVKIFALEERSIEFSHEIPQSAIPADGSPINITLNPNRHEAVQKIFGVKNRVKDLARVFNGVKPFEKGKGDPPQTESVVKEKPFVVERAAKPTGRHWMPLLRGSLIHRYTIFWNNDSWINYGPWLAAPRDPHIFSAQEKVLVRQTGDSIIATPCGPGFVARNNLHIIIPHGSVSSSFLAGVLNSRVMQIAYEYLNPEKGEALAEVKKKHVEQLPIPDATGDEQTAISNLVDEAVERRRNSSKCDISDIETKIDARVCHLFGVSLDDVQ